MIGGRQLVALAAFAIVAAMVRARRSNLVVIPDCEPLFLPIVLRTYGDDERRGRYAA